MKGSDLRFASFFNSGTKSIPLHAHQRLTFQAIGILTDLMFALIPIPMLYKIQVNWRVKLAVCGILSLGILYDPPDPLPHLSVNLAN